MDPLAATAIFLAAVAAIVLRLLDETAVVLAAIALMVLLAGYSPEDAFRAVDWNVIMILLGMWLLTGYLIEARIPEWIVAKIASRTRSYGAFMLAMLIASGFISMFLDNVLVILLLGSLVADIAVKSGRDPLPPVMLVGLSANFMGTALLMGDLPPQLLHSVTGVEFIDFIVFMGKPSSFPLLTVTFITVTLIAYRVYLRGHGRIEPPRGDVKLGPLAYIAVAWFLLTVAGMAARPLLGYELGFITMAGAGLAALTVETLRRLGVNGMVPFEKVLSHVEWRALMFYAGLFSLVGALKESGVLGLVAERLAPLLEGDPLVAYTVFYWVVGLLSTFIEHDALLLVFLIAVKEAASLIGVEPWGVYWGMAWSATLASNATVAAAPALYVALTIAEERRGRRVEPSELLRITVPYALASLAIHYVVSLPFWGLG